MNVNSSFVGGTKLLPVVLFFFATSCLFGESLSYNGVFEPQPKAKRDTIPYSKFEKDTASVSGNDENKVHVFVEEQPEFPQGTRALLKWIDSNLIYPKEARKKGIQGTVYVKFIIEKDGSVSNPQVPNSSERMKLLEEEALRVVNMMPNWTPGTHKGKPARVFLSIPIKFKFR